MWGHVSKSEAGRVDGRRLFQILAFMTEEFELKSACSGDLLKGANQRNGSNCVLEGNDESSFIAVKGSSWTRSADSVDVWQAEEG